MSRATGFKILALSILSITFAIVLIATPGAAFEPECGEEQLATPMQDAEKVAENGDTEGVCSTCSPPNECIYCNGGYRCVKQGVTCCGYYLCDSDEDCIYCMSTFLCVSEGSTCCYTHICSPDEYCYSPQQRCLRR
jgi:hypothetical protein